jgi:purine-nucleoside phosphorylase
VYRSFTAEQYKKHLLLPENYKVDGVLCYGTLYEDLFISILQECVAALGSPFAINQLDYPFLRFVREVKIKDQTIWFMIGYGGAWISEYLHWASLFGSQKNILLGSCGGLRPGMKQGDFIVPTTSYGEESSVRVYNRDSPLQYADKGLSSSLRARLEDENTTVWDGNLVTCQAMIGETGEDIERWSREGYSGVEMESSTLFAVSNHFNVPCAASLYVGDNLVEGHTNMSNSFANEADMRLQKQHKQINAALSELIT